MTATVRRRALIRGFFESADRFPARAALIVANHALTYRDLERRATSIAATIQKRESAPYSLAAVLAHRSATAYAAILGIHAAGKGHVPLNPKFPMARTRKMLLLSGCTVLIVAKEAVGQLRDVLRGVDRPLTVILPDIEYAPELQEAAHQHQFVYSQHIENGSSFHYCGESNGDAIAYLLFTSGTTAEPKGVPISQCNVNAYVQYVCDRYEVSERDRLSQEFDLTFDLSMHDMFVCWERGAALYCVPERAVMLPGKFIRDQQLTMWFSVPSVAAMLAKTRLLQPGCFPRLRCSLFCGEALPCSTARLWQEAAPNGILENLYGPTETTIAISHYRWDAAESANECRNGTVPIGWMFKDQQCCVVDAEHRPVSAGTVGELCLAGTQVAKGYWNNAEKTREQFICIPGTGPTPHWYRTGDLVKQEENGCLHYLGRTDHQVKVRGYRVELQEIEAVVRQASDSDQVVAVAWPTTETGCAEGVVAFVCGPRAMDEDQVLQRCRAALPEYMVPKQVFAVPEMPMNINGKIDRLQLLKRLERHSTNERAEPN